MWDWMNRAGRNFQQPRAGQQTNYLSAYDPKTKFSVPRNESVARTTTAAGPDTGDSDALEAAAVEETGSRRRRAGPSSTELQPFPMNREFVSQSILSETLRLEVWKRVQVDKKSVRQVSVELGIDMRRVGAVVRLVEVEKRMRAEVRVCFLLFPFPTFSMMSHKID